MPPTPTLTMTGRFDRQLAWYRGNSVRYLGVEITAPESTGTPRERTPLNLAVVIDASGSMQGAPLEAAKSGVEQVAGRLDDSDRLSLVSFDDEPTVHVEGADIGGNRGRIAHAVAGIAARRTTDLGAGWLAGAACAAAVMETDPGMRSRVVLLSDGHANRGITDPRELAHHAEELRVRGLTSSAIGIGPGYSAAQLEAIASAGGGRMHRADSASEIVEVLLGELEESEHTVAEDIAVNVLAPASCKIELVSAFPAKRTPAGLQVAAGSIAAGREAMLIFRIQTSPGSENDEVPVWVSGSWRAPGEDADRPSFEPVTLRLKLARGEENGAQPRDLDLSLAVARAWQTAIVRGAVQRNRDRRYGSARRLVEAELRHFRRYCDGLPGGQALVDELDALAAAIEREWDERDRQEVQLSSYKMSRRERETRLHGPASWSEAVPSRR